jgi:hypothetical protein
MNGDLLPLEKLFEKKSQDKSQLPHLSEDIFSRYTKIRDYLREHVYPLIGSGLSALSADRGIYTSHGPEHFDEVVKYAGHLLGCERGDEDISLSAYELYLLLSAIRLHDAGNAYGREEHEKRVIQILRTMGDVSGPDDVEKKLIAVIAEAHGGKTLDGSKDTISSLREMDTIGSVDVRPRLLAAIVRFADEICESRTRAAGFLLRQGALPRHNEVFHKYASCISSVKVRSAERTVSIKYALSAEDALKTWGKGKDEDNVEQVFLIDEIFQRLEKMFLERRYCVRFMQGRYNIDRIRAEIEIHDDNGTEILKLAIDEEDEGYPSLTSTLRDKYPEFTGEMVRERLSSELEPIHKNEKSS